MPSYFYLLLISTEKAIFELVDNAVSIKDIIILYRIGQEDTSEDSEDLDISKVFTNIYDAWRTRFLL